MAIKIALAGNPNCGKTTMFNALTGANQYVGNWPGVTVEKKEGKLKGKRGKGEDVIVTDLPGIYSMSPYTLEEVVSRDYVLKENPDVIIDLVDATNIERNLYLTTQLVETGVPVVIALNMADLLEKRGINILIEHPFTKEFAALTPERFIREVLVEKVGAKVIVVGDDFHFGYQRSGDVAFLKKHAEEYDYFVDNCEKLCVRGEEISSTMIRGQITEGNMEVVASLLGRPYEINGKVIPGKANGRKVDMRTANLAPDDIKLLPPEGVYASVVQIEGIEGQYYALTNIGRNPTISDDNDLRIETHVVDFSGDLYDRMMTVRIYLRLRAEHKFASLEEVKAQVMKDKTKAMAYFREHHI